MRERGVCESVVREWVKRRRFERERDTTKPIRLRGENLAKYRNWALVKWENFGFRGKWVLGLGGKIFGFIMWWEIDLGHR